MHRHILESGTQNRLGARIDLTEQFGVPAVLSETQLEPADTGEQAHHAPG